MADIEVSQHLKEVRKQLNKNLHKAYKGCFYWHRLMRKYRKSEIGRAAIILLPSEDDTQNYLALRYIDQMLENARFNSAILLTHSEGVKKTADMFSRRIIGVEWWPRKKAECLMQYYSLYNFDKRLFVASLDDPFGRNASQMVGKGGITTEELFVIGIYRLYPYTQLSPPEYTGNDSDIQKFLRMSPS